MRLCSFTGSHFGKENGLFRLALSYVYSKNANMAAIHLYTIQTNDLIG